MSGPSVLEFTAFGTLGVFRHGEPIDLGGSRARTLLAALVAEPGVVLSIDHLIDAVWGTGGSDRQRALWTAISRLRTSLEPDRPLRSDGTVVLTRATGYLLDATPESIDVVRFESLVNAGRSSLETNPEVAAAMLRDALALWRGDPFAEFSHLPFARARIARLDNLRLAAIVSRIDADLRCGRAAELVPELEALVAEHPLRDDVAGHLILAQARSGRRADALRTYALHRRTLIEQVGLEPSPAIRDLEARILADDPHVQPTRPFLASTRRRTDNLRPEPNALIDRPDIAELSTALEASRVVTLVGPGGIGKSRTARAVARRARDASAWGDGVWYVDLTAIDATAEPNQIAAAVATVIGEGHQATVPSPADVGAYLDGRRELIVLDNCEHVRASVASFVIDVFDRCSTVALLATSRIRLGTAHERPVELSTLPLEAAVSLFEARTAELGTGPFPPDDIERLCLALDAYPLAIELAAARTRTLSPADITLRLDRHPVLAQQRATALVSPDGPAHERERRHASLEAALEWSLAQLEPSAIATLHETAVFTDQFDLAAAESVLVMDGDDGDRLLDDLGTLIEHHLVTRDHTSDRFALLEPIRQTLLARRPTAARTHERHARHYLDEASRIGVDIHGTGEATAWDRLRSERVHLRDAVRWAAEHDEVDALESAMQWMALVVVNGGEIGPSRWADDALARMTVAPTDAPFTALTAAGGLLSSMRLDQSDETIDALTDVVDPRVRAVAAYLASHRHPAQMIQWADEMAVAAEQARDPALTVLAAAQGRRVDAIAIADQYGNPTLRALARFYSYVTMSADERRHGAAVADECYAAAAASNNALVMSQASAIRGNAICRTGKQLDRGAPLVLQALELLQRQLAEPMAWTFVESMSGMLAAMHREPETAALLWAAVDATRYVPSSRVTRYAEYPQWVESQLAPDELAELRARGEHLDLDAAMRELRAAIERFTDASSEPGEQLAGVRSRRPT